MSRFYPSMTTGERILALLPATSRELLDELQISPSTLHKWLTRLRAPERRKIRIIGWRRTRGRFAAVYVRGSGNDRPRPKARTGAEIQAKYIQSLKDAGLYEDYLADMRQYGAVYRRRKGQGRPVWAPDPLMAALYQGRYNASVSGAAEA